MDTTFEILKVEHSVLETRDGVTGDLLPTRSKF